MSAEQPATLLELVRRVAEEASVAQTSSGTFPATVSGQTGEIRRIINWTRDAWAEIQGTHHFNWMWEKATVTILAGTNVTAQTVADDRYVKDSAYYIDAGGGNYRIDYLCWDDFQLQYDERELAANNPVSAWTIRPDLSFAVNSTVLANLAIRVERYKSPTQLVADADEPGMPLDLRMLIVYKALVRYANSDEAGVMRQVSQVEVSRLERDLLRRCLPTMTIGGPLGDED